jgi:hypothetical protein
MAAPAGGGRRHPDPSHLEHDPATERPDQPAVGRDREHRRGARHHRVEPIGEGLRFVPARGRVTPEADDADHHDRFASRVVGRMAPRGAAWERAILVPIEAVW